MLILQIILALIIGIPFIIGSAAMLIFITIFGIAMIRDMLDI